MAIEKGLKQASTTRLSGGRFALEGTLEYSAPEIFKGQAYDERSECWAVGCFIYELVTGLPPFFSREQSRTA